MGMLKKSSELQEDINHIKTDIKDMSKKIDLIHGKVDTNFTKELFTFLNLHPWARRTIYVIIIYLVMGQNEWFGELINSVVSKP